MNDERYYKVLRCDDIDDNKHDKNKVYLSSQMVCR